jgi:hypothetical protein
MSLPGDDAMNNPESTSATVRSSLHIVAAAPIVQGVSSSPAQTPEKGLRFWLVVLAICVSTLIGALDFRLQLPSARSLRRRPPPHSPPFTTSSARSICALFHCYSPTFWMPRPDLWQETCHARLLGLLRRRLRPMWRRAEHEHAHRRSKYVATHEYHMLTDTYLQGIGALPHSLHHRRVSVMSFPFPTVPRSLGHLQRYGSSGRRCTC